MPDLSHVAVDIRVTINPPIEALSDPNNGATVISDHSEAHIPTDMVPIVSQVLARSLADRLHVAFQAVTDG